MKITKMGRRTFVANPELRLSDIQELAAATARKTVSHDELAADVMCAEKNIAEIGASLARRALHQAQSQNNARASAASLKLSAFRQTSGTVYR